jgi:hypothetical protein
VHCDTVDVDGRDVVGGEFAVRRVVGLRRLEHWLVVERLGRLACRIQPPSSRSALPFHCVTTEHTMTEHTIRGISR